MRNFMLGLVLALSALGFLATGSPAEARETYHGFAVQQHYVIEGGSPASFEQAGSNPLAVFRSEAAYANFRAHLGSFLGRAVSDADFRTLITSDRVRLVDCVGTIDTAGITDSGRVGYHNRACYTSSKFEVEKLIQLRLDDGRWVTVASLWCYNPVRGEVPQALSPAVAAMPAPPAPPAPPVSYMLQMPQVVTPTPSLVVGGIVSQLQDCCCESVIVSSPIIVTGGFSSTSGASSSNKTIEE